MNYTESLIPSLVDTELREANKKHPPFHSMHEGYAVLLEEVEETEEALKSVKDYLELVWHYIRWNKPEASQQLAEKLEAKAIHLAAEAIQVAAMARKFQAIGTETDMTEEEMEEAICGACLKIENCGQCPLDSATAGDSEPCSRGGDDVRQSYRLMKEAGLLDQ